MLLVFSTLTPITKNLDILIAKVDNTSGYTTVIVFAAIGLLVFRHLTKGREVSSLVSSWITKDLNRDTGVEPYVTQPPREDEE